MAVSNEGGIEMRGFKIAVRAEHKKLAHNPWWFVFFLIPIFPAVMGTVNYQMNLGILKNGWYDLWTQVTLFYANLFYGPMIAICCSYLWRLEHMNGNWNLFMTAPVPISCLYGAKLFEAVKLTVFLQIFVWILYVGGGKAAGIPGFPPAVVAVWLIRGTWGGMVIAALQLLLSMVIKSFSIPVVIGLLGGISGMLINVAGMGLYWPYGLMMIAMNSNQSDDLLSGRMILFLVMSIFYLSGAACISLLLLKKRDVNSSH